MIRAYEIRREAETNKVTNITLEVSGYSVTLLQKALARALSTWPDFPPELMDLSDRLEHGRPLQDYYSMGKSNGKQETS